MYLFAPFLLSFSSIVQAASTPARYGLSLPLTRHSNLQDTNGVVHVESLRRQIDHAARKFRGLAGEDAISPFPPGKRDPLVVRDASEPLTFADDIYLWTCRVKIGDIGFNLIPDSGSADMVVARSDCAGGCGNITNLYNPKLSGGVDLQRKFEEGYGSGSATGELYQDTVSIAGLTAEHQTLVAATEDSGYFGYSPNMDGLLGLAYPNLSPIGATPVFLSLVEQNQIANAVFGVSLSPNCSELHLGGINSKYSDEDFTYVDVEGEQNPGFWMVKSHDISLDEESVIGERYAIIDTGSGAIVGDTSTVRDFYDHIPGSSYGGDGSYSIPCDFNKSITIRFSDDGRGFTIPPDGFNLGTVDDSPNAPCVGGIVEASLPKGVMVIGDVFLRNFYTKFSFEENQVGLAALHEC